MPQPSEAIGIGITTYNRPDVLAWALRHHEAFRPAGARLVIIDDHSSTPSHAQALRNATRLGVARSKNRCLAHLAGCEHVFLFDDDAFPIASGWAEFYIGQGFAHVSHSPANTAFGLRVLRRHGRCQEMNWALGVMYYLHRSALDALGGYDARMGLWGEEHIQLSRRCAAAGLIPAPFLAPVDTEAYVRAMDLDLSATPLGLFDQPFRPSLSVEEKLAEQRRSYAVAEDLTVFHSIG